MLKFSTLSDFNFSRASFPFTAAAEHCSVLFDDETELVAALWPCSSGLGDKWWRRRCSECACCPKSCSGRAMLHMLSECSDSDGQSAPDGEDMALAVGSLSTCIAQSFLSMSSGTKRGAPDAVQLDFLP